ncbi:hypothetical protein ACIO6T_28015 [Streptomyces sp. NPDC087532]
MVTGRGARERAALKSNAREQTSGSQETALTDRGPRLIHTR